MRKGCRSCLIVLKKMHHLSTPLKRFSLFQVQYYFCSTVLKACLCSRNIFFSVCFSWLAVTPVMGHHWRQFLLVHCQAGSSPGLEQEREKRWAQLFEQLDLNKDGRIDILELQAGLSGQGLSKGSAEKVRLPQGSNSVTGSHTDRARAQTRSCVWEIHPTMTGVAHN